MKLEKKASLLLTSWVLLGTLSSSMPAQSDQTPAPVVSQSPEQLQQLVAPLPSIQTSWSRKSSRQQRILAKSWKRTAGWSSIRT